jgi:hypothetical protein
MNRRGFISMLAALPFFRMFISEPKADDVTWTATSGERADIDFIAFYDPETGKILETWSKEDFFQSYD